MADACRCECHLQPQGHLKAGLSSACDVLPDVWDLVSMSVDMRADMLSTSVPLCNIGNSMHVVNIRSVYQKSSSQGEAVHVPVCSQK